MTEIYRSRDGRWAIERHTDRYLVYDTDICATEEVWSCTTLTELYEWLAGHGPDLADLDEV